MDFRIDDRNVFINDSHVFEAPGEVVDTLVNTFNSETLLIIYCAYHLVPDKHLPEVYRDVSDPELQKTINQNVLCLDKNGNIVWQIEPTIGLPIEHIRFIKSRSDNEGVWVYRNDAREFKIDPSNGKVLEWKMGL